MTAPDPAILAAAITRMEAEIALFPEAEFPVEHEQTRAVVAAAKAYQPMREALEKADPALQYAINRMEGDFLIGKLEATLKAVRAALNPAGPS